MLMLCDRAFRQAAIGVVIGGFLSVDGGSVDSKLSFIAAA